MTTEKMLELAERCEKADGRPDRELDAAIAAAVGLPHGRDSGWCNNENGDYWVVDECAAHFTASLDAAMTLVPKGWRWCVDTMAGERIAAFVERDCGGKWCVSATPALALCAAALKARAGTQSKA